MEIVINHDLLIDLHKGNKRQALSGDEQTNQTNKLRYRWRMFYFEI